MKKLLTILLAVLMLVALAGCGKKEETPVEPTPTEDDGSVKIAVLLPFTGDQSYFDTLANAAKEVNDADNNITVDVYECDPNGAAEESNWMNWFISCDSIPTTTPTVPDLVTAADKAPTT